METQPRMGTHEGKLPASEKPWSSLAVETTEKEAQIIRDRKQVKGIRKDIYFDLAGLQEKFEQGSALAAIGGIPMVKRIRAVDGPSSSFSETVHASYPDYPYVRLADHTELHILGTDRRELARRVTDYFRERTHSAVLRTFKFTNKPIHEERTAHPEELYELLLEDKKREQDGSWSMLLGFSPPGLEKIESCLVIDSIQVGRRDIPMPQTEDGRYEFTAQATPNAFTPMKTQLDILSALRILGEFKSEGFGVDLDLSGSSIEEEGDVDIYYHAK